MGVGLFKPSREVIAFGADFQTKVNLIAKRVTVFFGRSVTTSVCQIQNISTESLILAQNERWRRG